MPDERYQRSQRQIRTNFERAAGGYDEVAQLQREVGERMLQQLALERFSPEQIVDIGAGTGYCTRGLESRFAGAEVVALDLAEGMLRLARKRRRRWRSRQRFLCADAHNLPLQSAVADLIFSNFTLQWCGDLPQVLAECWRVLRPGGLLFFSTLGAETLQELRRCWAELDADVHINQFNDLQAVGDLLLYSGYSEPVVSVDRFTLSYDSVLTLMRDLKGLGATNVNRGRRQGLTGRSVLKHLEQEYRPRGEDGRIEASWEVLYGHAWKPEGELGSHPEPFSLTLDRFGH